MYVKIRTVDGKKEAIVTISKLTQIEDLKGQIEKELHIEADLQRLFFRGKQLENGYTVCDYNINLNDVIQLMVKTKGKVEETCCDDTSLKKQEKVSDYKVEEELIETKSLHYKIGDAIDCLDQAHGAWFEATILNIFKKKNKLFYNVQWEFDDKAPAFNIAEIFIRPRARHCIPFDKLSVGQKIMVNYNIDDPRQVGLWYDFTITNIDKTKRLEKLTGVLHIGRDYQFQERKISVKREIYAIEQPKLLTERSVEDEKFMISNGKRRHVTATCTSCLDNSHKKCRECGCKICSGKQDEHNLLLCDECNYAYHLSCLDPPLTMIPKEDYWYCPECKNDENEIVKAGDKLKQSKKRNVAQDNSNNKRDWGKGMACVGRTKECSIVPSNHRGPIPGIEVGMCWMFRVQVSEAGVHRPHIAGIHGRETDCAYSIVLSGGYEDDVDNGDEFVYTGSGGRDLSGNKRTAEQSCDQTLTRMNKALAMNCKAKLNTKIGATAESWKDGISVRVVRNFKCGKHSKYAPKEGNRYDGIYKVVKYYPDTGKSGFRVWRYLLRRDDPTPAPWTKEGKERIASFGLKLIYPDGYLEATKKMKSPNKKRVTFVNENASVILKSNKSPPKKKFKHEIYKLDDNLKSLIENDKLNAKLWEECLAVLSNGKLAFLQQVLERFTCACCLEIVYNPVTIPCAHNVCLKCLKRTFASDIYHCPSCRYKLEKDYKMEVNQSLLSILLLLYPGYEVGR